MEKVVEIVRSHPILYDLSHPDYKDVRKKDDVWEKIGAAVGENGGEIKKKWRNLRDRYVKCLHAKKARTGQSARNNSWYWEQFLSFLKPYVVTARTESNIKEIDEPEAEEDYYEESEIIEIDVGEAVGGRKRKREEETVSPVEKVINFLQHRDKEEQDSVGDLFMSLAKTVREFSAMRQAKVKMMVAQLVLEEEMKELEERREMGEGKGVIVRNNSCNKN